MPKEIVARKHSCSGSIHYFSYMFSYPFCSVISFYIYLFIVVYLRLHVLLYICACLIFSYFICLLQQSGSGMATHKGIQAEQLGEPGKGFC